MAKTKEELNAIKEEVEAMNKKFAELTDEVLEQATGGKNPFAYIQYGTMGQPVAGAEVKVSSPIASVKIDRIEVLKTTATAAPEQQAVQLERR